MTKAFARPMRRNIPPPEWLFWKTKLNEGPSLGVKEPISKSQGIDELVDGQWDCGEDGLAGPLP